MNLMKRDTKIFIASLFLTALAACTPSQGNELRTLAQSDPVTAETTAKDQSLKEEPTATITVGQAQRVSFESADATKIVGSFYQSSTAKSPTVLLLHQWGSNRQSYDGFAKYLQRKGFNALAIDGRGFGESTKQADRTIPPSRSADAVAGMLSDVKAALIFLKTQPNVDSSRIGIVGASYGSSLAIIYAGDDLQVKTLVLLSPGLNYFGNLPTEPAAKKYGSRPLLLVAAADDKESAKASSQLDRLASGEKHYLKIYPLSGHGTGIFAAGVGLEKEIEQFLTSTL